jgi:hypothetical protein
MKLVNGRRCKVEGKKKKKNGQMVQDKKSNKND